MCLKSRRCVRSRSSSILSGPAPTRDPFMMAIHLGLSFTPPQKSLCHSPLKLTRRGQLLHIASKQKHQTICVISKFCFVIYSIIHYMLKPSSSLNYAQLFYASLICFVVRSIYKIIFQDILFSYSVQSLSIDFFPLNQLPTQYNR